MPQGGGGLIGQTGKVFLAGTVGKLHLPQQHAAQNQVFRHRKIRLGAETGTELAVNEQKAADGTGQSGHGHHAAKQLPEKTQAPHSSNRYPTL